MNDGGVIPSFEIPSIPAAAIPVEVLDKNSLRSYPLRCFPMDYSFALLVDRLTITVLDIMSYRLENDMANKWLFPE
jgi:hypothetical protein